MNEREMNYYDDIVNFGIATSAELDLAGALMKDSWEEVLNTVLFIRTGFHSYEQLMNEMGECEDDDDGDDILACMRESVGENWY